MATIRFEAHVETTGSRMLVRLPAAASAKLPSRGQVAASGTLDDHPFRTVVEPDGDFGHWISIDAPLRRAAGLAAGAQVTIALEPTKEWPEPSVPAELRKAIEQASPRISDLWHAITPMARWEWVRWVNATRQSETRNKRIEVSVSKLGSGKRRPCCFNLASCTDPELSRSGKLRVDPPPTAKPRPAAKARRSRR
jgi:hypothetical protein